MRLCLVLGNNDDQKFALISFGNDTSHIFIFLQIKA